MGVEGGGRTFLSSGWDCGILTVWEVEVDLFDAQDLECASCAGLMFE